MERLFFSCDGKLNVLACIHGLCCPLTSTEFDGGFFFFSYKYWQNSKLLFVPLQLFQGNYDRNSEVKHVLVDGVLAKYLRFLPKTHRNRICMRTEVFGVKLEPGRDFSVA